jgi:hypothetical protein
MLEIKQVEFKFKGNRKYIHGTDMFNKMTDFGHLPSHLHNIRFIAHKVVHSPLCNVYLTDKKEELNEIADICVRCQFDIDQSTHWMALTQATSAIPEQRYAYDEDQIVSLCSLKDSAITLTAPSAYSFIENIVAMNKHLHQHLFPEADGNWFFTRIDLDSGCEERAHLELHFRHNMNYRLTRSDILANGQKLGDLYFSLVKA